MDFSPGETGRIVEQRLAPAYPPPIRIDRQKLARIVLDRRVRQRGASTLRVEELLNDGCKSFDSIKRSDRTCLIERRRGNDCGELGQNLWMLLREIAFNVSVGEEFRKVRSRDHQLEHVLPVLGFYEL